MNLAQHNETGEFGIDDIAAHLQDRRGAALAHKVAVLCGPQPRPMRLCTQAHAAATATLDSCLITCYGDPNTAPRHSPRIPACPHQVLGAPMWW